MNRIQAILSSCVKFPLSVMVCWAISSAGVSALCFIRSMVNAAVNLEIIEHVILPSAYQLYGHCQNNQYMTKTPHRLYCKDVDVWCTVGQHWRFNNHHSESQVTIISSSPFESTLFSRLKAKLHTICNTVSDVMQLRLMERTIALVMSQFVTVHSSQPLNMFKQLKSNKPNLNFY